MIPHIPEPLDMAVIKRRPQRRSLPVIINPLTCPPSLSLSPPRFYVEDVSRQRSHSNPYAPVKSSYKHHIENVEEHSLDNNNNTHLTPDYSPHVAWSDPECEYLSPHTETVNQDDNSWCLTRQHDLIQLKPLSQSKHRLSKSLDILPIIENNNRHNLKRTPKPAAPLMQRRNQQRSHLPHLYIPSHREHERSLVHLIKASEHESASSNHKSSIVSIPESTPDRKPARDESHEDMYHLPPLPSGSPTFQSAMMNLHPNDHSSSEESGTEDMSSIKKKRNKRLRKSNLVWSGPIVEYRGHHIFLSTLKSMQVILSRYGNQQWR